MAAKKGHVGTQYHEPQTTHEQRGIQTGGPAAANELVITRVIDGPRELVFDAWTDQHHLVHWWGPKGFTTSIQEMDVHPGGVWRYIMHGPDGRNYQKKIIYEQVVRPELMVMNQPGDEGEKVTFRLTTTFVEEGKGTRVTMRTTFPNAQERERVVRDYNAIDGAKESLDRLSEHVHAMASGQDMIINRTFNAPIDLVFDAFTNQKYVYHWWGPKGFTNPICEIDTRPGGNIRIDMRAPDGKVYPMTGVIRELVRPNRYVFSSTALDDTRNPVLEVLQTVSLVERNGKTDVTISAKVQNVTPTALQYVAGMNEGWNQSLDRLNDVLKREGRT